PVEIGYPRFHGAKFGEVNDAYRRDAEAAEAEALEAFAEQRDDEYFRGWETLQRGTAAQIGVNAVGVRLLVWAYTGGAHGNGGTLCSLVDLRNGKSAKPGDVFAGDDWREKLVPRVDSGLRRLFKTKPGFGDAVPREELLEALKADTRFCWGEAALTIVFDPYEVGPYAHGTYEVVLPYANLAALLRKDGPVKLGR
ncbi:MAG: DUF3298 domain-containing protein, partial [Alphaproteobacteria bacterium]|nr:DUF3298 domain-containing protein [Alphaproteobacteria bacterium]